MVSHMITIHRDGVDYGPYEPALIPDMIASGNLTKDDLAWTDGAAEWVPLSDLVALDNFFPSPPPPPAPPKIAAQSVETYQEPGIYVGADRITLGSTTFAVKNVGGVSVRKEKKKLRIPFYLIVFGLFFCGMGISASKAPNDEGISGFCWFMGIGLLTPAFYTIFRKPIYYLEVAASGGLQNALQSTDRERIGRIAAAIHRVIAG